MLAIGCFSVGTDQVAIRDAARRGIPVFNAPHASTRSVAELTLGGIIALARRLGDKSNALHHRQWDKSLAGAHEVRGRTVGIIGYGHIGQQVGLLAEAFGMRVLFHDIVKKLALGLARPVADLDGAARGIGLRHAPRARDAAHRGHDRRARSSRACARAATCSTCRAARWWTPTRCARRWRSGHLGGAALDVYPAEPTPTVAEFDVGFADLPNVILTPHVGGNTEEAQRSIGLEVAHALSEFIDRGSTEGAVNFPQVNLPAMPDTHRILNIHQNVPGVLAAVNNIVSESGRQHRGAAARHDARHRLSRDGREPRAVRRGAQPHLGAADERADAYPVPEPWPASSKRAT